MYACCVDYSILYPNIVIRSTFIASNSLSLRVSCSHPSLFSLSLIILITTFFVPHTHTDIIIIILLYSSAVNGLLLIALTGTAPKLKHST